MQINENEFRQTMRLWATGVTVVTSMHAGKSHGMTVSSFTSVSANPPVVCVSINNQARTHQLITESDRFGVTILEASQGAISDCFAGRIPEDGDRFDGVQVFTLETGSPLIEGGIAFFDCKVIKEIQFGQNTVFFGEVQSLKYLESGNPLLYTNRSYQTLQK